MDSAFSLEPLELEALVTESKRAWQALGGIQFGLSASEKPSLQFRRSLYVGEDMKSGDVFTSKNLRSIRPGLGLPPKHYSKLIGQKVKRDVKKGTPITWNLVK